MNVVNQPIGTGNKSHTVGEHNSTLSGASCDASNHQENCQRSFHKQWGWFGEVSGRPISLPEGWDVREMRSRFIQKLLLDILPITKSPPALVRRLVWPKGDRIHLD